MWASSHAPLLSTHGAQEWVASGLGPLGGQSADQGRIDRWGPSVDGRSPWTGPPSKQTPGTTQLTPVRTDSGSKKASCPTVERLLAMARTRPELAQHWPQHWQTTLANVWPNLGPNSASGADCKTLEVHCCRRAGLVGSRLGAAPTQFTGQQSVGGRRRKS